MLIGASRRAGVEGAPTLPGMAMVAAKVAEEAVGRAVVQEEVQRAAAAVGAEVARALAVEAEVVLGRAGPMRGAGGAQHERASERGHALD